MNQTLQTKTKSNRLFQERMDANYELGHINGMDLTDSEIEFLNMKRMKAGRRNYANYSPDPRLGDYEA